MPTIFQIKANYKNQHDTLSQAFYAKKRSTGVTQAEQDTFNAQHKAVWDNCDTEIKTASDYVEPVKPRDLVAELDTLKTRIKALEGR